jgi:hypothetical protein
MAASRRLDLLLKRPEALLHRRGHVESLSKGDDWGTGFVEVGSRRTAA